MSAIVKLVQGSPEWHEHRRHHRNASETPAVLGVSPWTTPYQLWQIKTGRAPQPEVTAAMAHGTELEPQAREAYERQTGHVIEPLVMVDGKYSASLDGLTLGSDRIVEIKCPVNGRDSTLWKTVELGRLPEHYVWQVQHQLMVTRADIADVFVFTGSEGIVFPVAPDPTTWSRIHEDWDRFTEFVATSTPPPLTKRDTRLRDDLEWLKAAAAYLEAKHAADATATVLVDAKEQLLRLASHVREEGGGVSVSRYWKAGAIEYKKVPELAGIDLEQYRSAERQETRITVLR